MPPESPEASPYRLTHERGPMTRQVRSAAFAEGGEALWRDLLQEVSPDCRARFAEPIGYFDWVASEHALELHEAWVRRRGVDDMGLRGEAAAREILGGVQRWLLGLASPGFLVENLPRAFGFYYRGGSLGLAELGPGRAELRLRAAGYPPAWFREGLPSAFRVALGLTANEAEVSHHPPEPGGGEPFLHRYELRWKA